MPVTPITPAQIDEVGNGASASQTEPSPSAEPLRVSSRGPAAIAGELTRLSSAAAPGLWRNGPRCVLAQSTNPHIGGDDVVVSTAYSDRSLSDDDRNCAFIVALVNAYRAGELVPAFAAAKPSGGWHELSKLPPQTKAMLGRWCLTGHNENDSGHWYWQQASGRYFDYLGERHWCLDGYVFEGGPFYGEAPTHFLPIDAPPPRPGALGTEARSAETGTGSVEDEGPACKATPSIPPSPRKGQEENPCPMTVEEARALLDGVRDPKALADYYRNMGAIDGSPWQKRVWFGHAESIELALSTIRASEEDR